MAIIGGFTLLHLLVKFSKHLIEIADVKYQVERYKYEVIRNIKTLKLPKQDVRPLLKILNKDWVKQSKKEQAFIAIQSPYPNYLDPVVKHDLEEAKQILKNANGRLRAMVRLTAKDVETLLEAIEQTEHYYLSTLVIDNEGKIHRVYFKDNKSLENFVKNGWEMEKKTTTN